MQLIPYNILLRVKIRSSIWSTERDEHIDAWMESFYFFVLTVHFDTLCTFLYKYILNAGLLESFYAVVLQK